MGLQAAGSIRALEPFHATPGPHEGEDVLTRAVLALNSTLALGEVLKRLGEIGLQEIRADRCTILLLDGRALKPGVCIARRPDGALWDAFQTMPNIDLGAIPSSWDLLLEGRAIAVEFAPESPLIPPTWAERFCLTSLVLAPLLAAGEPCGLMVVDSFRPRRFTSEELTLLETVGSCAGLAVRNAGLYEAESRRAALQEALAHTAQELISPVGPRDLARRLVDALAELPGAKASAVVLLDHGYESATPLASSGQAPICSRLLLNDVPDAIRSRLVRTWMRSHKAVEFGAEEWFGRMLGEHFQKPARFLVFPLVVSGRVAGAVLIGFPTAGIERDERSAAEALIAMASAALERHALMQDLQRHLRRLEILHDLNGELARRPTAKAVITRLNRMLEGQDFEVTSIAFRDRALARLLGGAPLQPGERLALRDGARCLLLEDGTIAVPMKLGRRRVGTLRFTTKELDDDGRAFLESLAQGVAEAAMRTAMRLEVEETRRERALAAERARIAADLHDTVGQEFIAIALNARREAEKLPADSEWRDRFRWLAGLAEAGKTQLDQALQALESFPEARYGLPTALRALGRTFESYFGMTVMVDVKGRQVRLPPKVEKALYGVVHESVTKAFDPGRSSALRLELFFDRKYTKLSIADDGMALTRRHPDPWSDLAPMRRALHDVGGDLRVRRVRPRGIRLEATIPREAR